MTEGNAQLINTVELASRIRRHALRMTSRGGTSHIGSILSVADILGVLYGSVLRLDPARPEWDRRDRFVLSKGHAGAGVYAALAELGFLSLESLDDHCADGSVFSGHLSHKGVPGVELSTGSLGHGLSVAAGMAFALKQDGSDSRTVCLLSDGECDEGSTWEAVLFAAHHGLGALTAIVDYNKIQSLDSVSRTLGLEPFADKWTAFGWSVVEVDGHDHAALHASLDARAATDGAPRCVIAHTVKGKGVSFMENTVLWHYRTAKGDEYRRALAELDPEA